MILFSPAKINIGLHVLRKRSDDFHDLDTLMYPLPFYDMIEIAANTESDTNLMFTASGIQIPGTVESNLCIQAFNLFNSHAGTEVNITMHLYKQIPIGAGLGGGSSNASSMLLGMNNLSDNKFSIKELTDLAAQLGSDCPLFIHKKPMLASGRGEILKDTRVDLCGFHLVLCNPGIMIPTTEAYSRVVPIKDRPPLEENLSMSVSEWEKHIVNDFEASVFALYPEIETLKLSMYQSGALYASMSGSGSSVYGIFRSRPELADDILESLIWEGSL